MYGIGGTQPLRRLEFHALVTANHCVKDFTCHELSAATTAVEYRSVLVGECVKFPIFAAWAGRADCFLNTDGFKSKHRAAAHAMLRLGHVHREAIVTANRRYRAKTIVANSSRFADEPAASRAFVRSGSEHARSPWTENAANHAQLQREMSSGRPLIALERVRGPILSSPERPQSCIVWGCLT